MRKLSTDCGSAASALVALAADPAGFGHWRSTDLKAKEKEDDQTCRRTL